MTRPFAEARSAYKVFCQISTRWSDNDVYGHVNNVQYYSFFDTVVNRYLIEAGALCSRPDWTVLGLATLDWIAQRQIAANGLFRPVGSEGFGHAHHQLPFDQQPLEAQAAIELEALAEFARASALSFRFIEFMPLDGRGFWTREKVISEAEILERCTLAMINEGAKILDEGIAIRASDIDVVWVNGYGWPVYRGGPMHHADQMGLAEVVAKLKAYGPLMGPNFTISPLLERMAAEGKKFTA